MNSSLRIMEWNANGLLQHKDELQIILNTQKIDICLISETHFTKETYIKFCNYITYHTLHPANTARGGSAVIIRENIEHWEEEKISEINMQVTSVTIKTLNQKLTVSALYRPPGHSISAEQYTELFSKLNNRFIIGGDFNAKHIHWGSRTTQTTGRELFNAASDYGCEFVSTGKPTYWPTDPNKTPDLIDLFVTKNVSPNYMKIEEAYDLNSDHSPILLTICDRMIERPQSPVLINNRTNWNHFNNLLENNINLRVSLKTVTELEQEVYEFTVAIQDAAWKSTPIIKRKLKGLNFPKEIRDKIAEKRKLRKRWHQTRAPQDKTALNRATNQLAREIKEVKRLSINNFLSGLTACSSTDYSLWKATKYLKRPKLQVPALKKDDGKWARSNQEKADAYAEHLESRFQPNPGTEDLPKLQTKVYNDSIPLVTIAEVAEEINFLNSKKAPGFDMITGTILKKLPRKGLVKLTTLINASVRLKHVPNSWKVSEIIMLPKPGKDHRSMESYRPIALLPIMSKLFEKLILKRLNAVIEKYQLVPTHQFGFRSSHSTMDQVHRITDIIETALERKKICSAMFLDISQAFDRVWHKGLLHKLESILPNEYNRLFKSYLSDRKFRIRQEDAYSDIKDICAGVPQGSVLGPVLYLLYISDIPKTFHTTIATFADDTALLAVGNTLKESNERLQQSINNVATWTKKWRIQLNETKSTFINFTNKRIGTVPIHINGVPLQPANTAKYLGMNLDVKLRWCEHVKKKVEELNIKFRKMYWLIGRHSELAIESKILLYKQVLRPVWTYGIQIWGCAKKSHIQKIQVFQNKVLRSIANAPKYVRVTDLHRDLDVEMVADIIKKHANSHQRRLEQHINEEASRLLMSRFSFRRLKRVKPFELSTSDN